MFRNALQLLHKPLQSSVESASFTKHAAHWTTLAVLSFAALIIVLDNTLLNGALLSLPCQLGAEDSMLQWFDRAKGVACWTAAASEAMGVSALSPAACSSWFRSADGLSRVGGAAIGKPTAGNLSGPTISACPC